MNTLTKKAVDWLKRQIEWIDFSQKRYNKRIAEEREYRDSHPVSVQQAKENLTAVVSKFVERGWRIEMQNEFDVILSKKQGFNWVFHLILLLILAVIFAPLALFWLFVMVILAVTKRQSTKRVWVEKNGEVFER
jgi:septum formation topological specificity factor MinE